MAEGTYEYECMRAELLGVAKPDYDEFVSRQPERCDAEDEAIDCENLKEVEGQGEAIQGTAGKLDELNTILAATQKKLDRFRFRCGSVTELIKTKIGSIAGTPEQGETPQDSPTTHALPTELPPAETAASSSSSTTNPPPPEAERKSQLTRALDNHTCKLDDLLDNTEGANSKMQNLNDRIRRLL